MMRDTGFVCGAFDLCHAGHLLMLEECSNNCNKLIVGLHTDPSIDRPSKNRPIESVLERYLRLESCKFVSKIIPYDTESDLMVLLKSLDINIRFLGDDYLKKDDYTGAELDIEIFFCKRYGYSSSLLRNRIKKTEA